MDPHYRTLVYGTAFLCLVAMSAVASLILLGLAHLEVWLQTWWAE